MVGVQNLDEDFAAFWAAYPRKVGKLAARKAYIKARKEASAEDILNGIRDKGIYTPHPSTYLHQGRWMDAEPEYFTPFELQDARKLLSHRFGRCLHDPKCLTHAACVEACALERRRRA